MTLKLAIWIAAGLALVAVAGAIYLSGRDDHAAAVTKQNMEAGHGADLARSRFDAGCPDGMRFDSYAGKCAWPAASGRH